MKKELTNQIAYTHVHAHKHNIEFVGADASVCPQKGGTNTVGADAPVCPSRPKCHKGITLIALIITIIVMLILVAVTINVALNEGLFTTAKKAAEETQYAADNETLQSAKATAMIEGEGTLTEKNLENNLPDGWNIKAEGDGTYTVTSPSGNTFIVDGDEITDENESNSDEWWLLRDGEAGEDNSFWVGDTLIVGVAASCPGPGVEYYMRNETTGVRVAIQIYENLDDYGRLCDGELYFFLVGYESDEACAGLEQKTWYCSYITWSANLDNWVYQNITKRSPAESEWTSNLADGEVGSESLLERIMQSFKM